jgi:hypothetical protein
MLLSNFTYYFIFTLTLLKLDGLRKCHKFVRVFQC